MIGQDAARCPGPSSAPLDEGQAAELAKVFKALGDPLRLSHHLKLLRQAGLIDCERRGTWVYYWVLPAALDRLAVFLKTPTAVEALT
ncbi:putative transcriptional regulator, ArsR family protein [Streptomyces spinoverrucosus]|uniref:Putative transcriptional regulator, ArsR family protein n=1 Tax=Streptomyces spinoverrucosus TaxID=284043 RepID=A0A4Y3VTK8_9ACTN|nr:putative transcriptional regulator, ArsR family protein [Streptomyces spinoverrucosus]GHB93717.1 putative transcriptional regulator, ArsR family protein [Streptomyces spinoverrucosus]